MQIEDLKRELHALIDACDDELTLEVFRHRLRNPSEDAVELDNRNVAEDELVSFDADGTGYTAQQLGDTLDERVRAMRRGEGVLTLEQFTTELGSWRKHFE